MGGLTGKVAVVTGASRGIGKGIACALAEQGATIYVTARTVHSGEHELAGSLVETVAEVERRGGKGIAVPMDVTNDEQIAAVFERVKDEQGRLDILANNAMAVPAAMTQSGGFWEKPLSNWQIFDTGLRAALIASWHAARIMVPQRSGLIVGLSGYVGATYTYDVVFGTTKSGVDRMARDMAIELEPHNVASLSLWQGFTFTERALNNLQKVAGMANTLKSAAGSSPEFPGRVIAALAMDPTIMAKSGGSFINAELGAEYGLTDIDGRTIESLRDVRGTPIWKPIREVDYRGH